MHNNGTHEIIGRYLRFIVAVSLHFSTGFCKFFFCTFKRFVVKNALDLTEPERSLNSILIYYKQGCNTGFCSGGGGLIFLLFKWAQHSIGL